MNAYISDLQPLRFFYKVITQTPATFQNSYKMPIHIVVELVITRKRKAKPKKAIKEEKTQHQGPWKGHEVIGKVTGSLPSKILRHSMLLIQRYLYKSERKDSYKHPAP